MKTFLLAALALTFTATAFAECRIAFEGQGSDYISRKTLLEKDYQLVDISELADGDYVASVELANLTRSKNEISNNFRSSLSFEQVISRVDVVDQKVSRYTLRADEISLSMKGYKYSYDFDPAQIGKVRGDQVPKCSRLSKKSN